MTSKECSHNYPYGAPEGLNDQSSAEQHFQLLPYVPDAPHSRCGSHSARGWAHFAVPLPSAGLQTIEEELSSLVGELEAAADASEVSACGAQAAKVTAASAKADADRANRRADKKHIRSHFRV